MQDQPKPVARVADKIGSPAPQQDHRHHPVARAKKGLPGGKIPCRCIGKKVFEHL